jgi:hypothetical protein
MISIGLHAQTKGKTLLEQYSSCRHVEPEDNKTGFSIVKISNEDGGKFFVQWKSSSDMIMKNSRFHQYMALLLYFIDANDFSNYKNGLSSGFKGALGELDKMIVTLDKPAESVIIYFKGIDSSIANSEPFLTSPLFFMADLGDNPELLDEQPRYAGDLFEQVVKEFEKAIKKDE